MFFGFRTENCVYKEIGPPYIFDVNIIHLFNIK